MYIMKSAGVLCMLFLVATVYAEQDLVSPSPQAENIKTEQFTAVSCKSCFDGVVSTANKSDFHEDLTLKKVISLTLLNNPELKAFSFEQRAAEARTLQAGLWPNPEIDLEVENIGGTGELSGFDGAETTIALSQVIELGNKSQKRKNIAEIDQEIVDWEYKATRLQVLGEAAKAYINVLAAQERLHSIEHLQELSMQALEAAAKRVQAGKDSPLEETRAEVVVANIKIELEEGKRNLEFSRKKLVSYWCSEHRLTSDVRGNLEKISDIPEFEPLIRSLSCSPAFLRWQKVIAKNQAQIELEKAKSSPDITFSAGMKRFNETDDNALVFGVSIPLPIFDNNRSGRREAYFNLCKAKEEQRAAILKLQNSFYEHYQDLRNAYSKATSLKNEVLPAGMKGYKAATIAYKEGKTDFISVLDAQRTFFELRSQYIESLVSYHIAKIQIESSIGQKIDSIDISQSEEQK